MTTKIQPINPENYFVESEKVYEMVKEIQEEARKALPANYRLTLAKELLEDAKSREEYEALVKEIKELELEIKYDKGYFPAIPEEHHQKIAFNRVFEEEKLDAELANQKAMLAKLVDGLEVSLGTVLNNIAALENRKNMGKTIDAILDFKIYKDRTNSDLSHLTYLAYSSTQINAEKAYKASQKFFNELNKITESPTFTPEAKKPSIKKRLLGGWK